MIVQDVVKDEQLAESYRAVGGLRAPGNNELGQAED